MTYSKGNLANASDYNGYAGLTSHPAASAAAATAKAGYLWGVGFGDRGYGQSSPSLMRLDQNELMLEAKSIDPANNTADGGFIFERACPSATAAYRFSQWVYVNKSSRGHVYFGTEQNNSVLDLNGAANGNPYWLFPTFDGVTTSVNNSAASNLTVIKRNPLAGEWVLFVGILQGSGYAGTGLGSGISGVYDVAGNQIIQVPDFKLAAGATLMTFRTFLYYSDDSTQRVYIARPRLEQITGSEPTISQLIAMTGANQPIDTLINPSTWKAGDTASGTWTNPSGAGAGWSVNGSTGGETTIVQSSVLGGTGSPVSAMMNTGVWTNLRTVLNNLATWQGTSTSLLPPAANLSAGHLMRAEVSGNTGYDIPSLLNTLDSNRMVFNAGNMSATVGALTITRGSTWGSGSSSIVAEMTYSFPTEDAARFFFNSGGSLDLVLAHPNTSTTQDSNWNTILSALGTISISAKSTSRSGSGGTPSGTLGYYTLSTAYQTVFNGTNIGTGAYSANSVMVDALVSSVGGVNGGNGTTVKVRVTLTDGHTNSFSDIVQSGTNAAFGFKKAAVTLTGIASPTTASVTNF